MPNRKPYPSDVSDEEWAFVIPYLALIREDAPQRTHGLREVFNALRWIVRSGAPWRMLPHDFPPWEAVYQQTHRWLRAEVFEAIVHDLRALLRLGAGRDKEPTAAILDSRTLKSTPESGNRSGYDGAKRKNGSKVHAAVDTLGYLLALHVTPADEQDREQVEVLAKAIQEATGENVELAYVDQGYSGEQPAEKAKKRGIRLEVVKHPESKRGFVLLPRRWVIERDFAWTSRFRRLVKDYERLPETVAGLHFVAFACLFLYQAIKTCKSHTWPDGTCSAITANPHTHSRSGRGGVPTAGSML
jgi:transposase